MPRKKKVVESEVEVLPAADAPQYTIPPYLKKENIDLVKSIIDAKWKNKVCEVCANNNWIMMDTLYALGDVGGQSHAPLAIVTCNNCANIKLFGALLLLANDGNKNADNS